MPTLSTIALVVPTPHDITLRVLALELTLDEGSQPDTGHPYFEQLTFDEDAQECCHPGAYHDGCGCGRAECAPACDDHGADAKHSPLMRMPRDAATPVPTMTAVGVAKPRAHGHAMTMTLMPNSSANRKGVWP
eukprot:1156065-Pelagomonas_calceolata.AAC.1